MESLTFDNFVYIIMIVFQDLVTIFETFCLLTFTDSSVVRSTSF
jgi:hypothetical protein